MQTMAASVAVDGGMGVLIQAMVWLGMPLPPAWKLMLYFGCIGMFGVGVGMLYTPILVDRLQLEYPSGHAVANILRALTDPRLLRRRSALGGGIGAGVGRGRASRRGSPLLEAIGISASTIGAGMIVGSRIGVPAAVIGGIGGLLTPWLSRSAARARRSVPQDRLPVRARDDPRRGDPRHVAASRVEAVRAGAARRGASRRRAAHGRPSTRPPRRLGRRSGASRWCRGHADAHSRSARACSRSCWSFLFLMVNGISHGITD